MKKAKTPKTPEFDPSPALLKRARKHLAAYSFAIQSDGDGGFIGSASELPGVLAEGETLDECARNLSFALETVIASYLTDGDSPPAPTRREKRTEQVNVRFTRTERNLLERESAKQGFRGIGDLIRAQAIRGIATRG
jgi:predicted RNase H-like HicB family nuclease